MLVRWRNGEGLYRMVDQSNSYTCNKIANGIMENHGWKTMGGKPWMNSEGHLACED
jgi:hypothetical protein